jgi:hypothetical protein
MTHRIAVLTFSALTLLAGCNDVATTNPDTATAASGSVELTVVADALDGKAAKRFAEAGAEAKIRELAASSLRSTGRWDDSMSITVTLEDFRLRTAGAVAMVGAMAGADRIDAQVAVMKDGQVIRSEKVSAMSRQGGMVGAKESKRLEGLVTTFAQNMAALL